VRANLQFARNQAQGPSFSPSAWQRWLSKTHSKRMDLLATGPVWLWFSFYSRRCNGGNSGKTVSALFYLPWLPCHLFSAVAWPPLFMRTRNSKLLSSLPAKPSSAMAARGVANSFAVHDGAELRVLDRKMIGYWSPRSPPDWLAPPRPGSAGLSIAGGAQSSSSARRWFMFA